MKTIRNDVFETNSSSTHSISITKINKSDKVVRPLLQNNVLNIDNLKDYYEDYTDDKILICSTFETKLALVACYIVDLSFDHLDILIDKLENTFNIEIIGDYTRCNYNDEGEDIFPYEGDLDEHLEALDKLIVIINDPTMQIIDATIEY